MGKNYRILMLCIAIIFFSLHSFAQAVTTVSGSVKNSKTKESIPAVSVVIKGNAAGAFTDDKGNFKFTTKQKPPFTLIISVVSYEPKEIEFTGEASLNIELNES